MTNDITRRIADVLREHDWYATGNRGEPGMPDSASYMCQCGWRGDTPRKHVAEVLVRELAPDIDEVAQEIWQTYVVETGHSLPAGLADKLARVAVAAWVRADTEEEK